MCSKLVPQKNCHLIEVEIRLFYNRIQNLGG